MEPDNDFFVNIENPELFRRNILECSKETINLLRQMGKIRQIRIEKIEISKRLDGTMKEISALNNRIKTILPKTSIRISPDTILSSEKIKVPKKASEKQDENLDKKLDYIESRLKELGI